MLGRGRLVLQTETKMQDIADTVREEIKRLVPLSLVQDVSCFVFYDHHPQCQMQDKPIDIIVCTKHGELKEFFRRGNVSSISLETASPPTEVEILRNSKCELFYLVRAGTELLILSTKGGVGIHEKITNVDTFTLDDSNCNGELSLKVFKADDAVPIVFDDNFKIVEEEIIPDMPANLEPLALQLKRKLVEAKYSVENHQHLIRGYVKMRHNSAMKIYGNLNPNHDDSFFKNGEFYEALKIRCRRPWVKVCNKKLVIALTVRNEYNEPVEELDLIPHEADKMILCYETKRFDTHPSLQEKETRTLLPNHETTIVAVMFLDDVTLNYKIVLNIAISFKVEKVYLMPLDDIFISSLDVLGDEFDSLSASEININTLIAVQSTSVRTDIRLRDIEPNETESLSRQVQSLVIEHLQMVRAGPDMVIYKQSPYHALNGTLMHFLGSSDKTADVTVYTRSEAQVLALIKCIINAVPKKIIITTSNYLLSAKIPELTEFDEPMPVTEFNYSEYAKTILKRTELIIEYLDWCMVKMSESKDPEVVRQVGFQIDLYACGRDGYSAFKDNMKAEGDRGLLCLTNKAEPDAAEPMVVG